MRILNTACLLVLVLSSVTLSSCNERKTSSNATNLNGPAIRLMALDDPRNPYAGMYDEWDVWAHETLSSQERIEPYRSEQPTYEAFEGGLGEDPWDVREFYAIDKNGSLLPSVEEVRLFEEAFRTKAKNSLQNYTLILVKGRLDPEIQARKRRSLNAVRASFYPTIPEWLGTNPPAQVTLMPNGDFIAWGDLGGVDDHHMPSHTSGDHYNSEPFYRFDCLGNLLGSTEEHWWYLYYGLDKPKPEGRLNDSQKGIITFLGARGELLSQWFYNGTEYDSSRVPDFDAYAFLTLSKRQVETYYELQRPVNKGE